MTLTHHFKKKTDCSKASNKDVFIRFIIQDRNRQAELPLRTDNSVEIKK